MAWPEIHNLLNRPWVRCLALVVLSTAFTRFEPLPTAVLDLDLWWHLRAGDTIVAQHSFPRHAVFTQHSERPWIDYSWGFEVIVSRLYHWFGLMGLVGLRIVLEAAIAAILFVFLQRMLISFWQAYALTALGMWTIHHCLNTRPMLFSIALFTAEIGLIFEARRRTSVRPLWLLPPLFVLWANVHIQFFYGIVALGLLLAMTAILAVVPAKSSSWFAGVPRLPLDRVLAVTALSIVATAVGPYSWHLYSVLLDYARSSAPYALILELQALNFRVPSHFLLVLTIGAAFFALGWRRSRDPYKLLLLVICTIIALRMSRDSWIGCIPALAIIADRDSKSVREKITSWARGLSFAGATAFGTCLMLLAVAWDQRVNNDLLTRIVALNYPADACAFIHAHALPGPIYNDANWGGYLIWELPDKPVAIDNRTDLYGDDLVNRFHVVQHGLADWRDDPDLNAARLVLLSRFLQLTNQLYHDKRFRLVYQDHFSVVFIRNDVPLSASKEFAPAASYQ
jgi:hypothetical protein